MKEEKGSGAEAEAQSQLVAKEDNQGKVRYLSMFPSVSYKTVRFCYLEITFVLFPLDTLASSFTIVNLVVCFIPHECSRSLSFIDMHFYKRI